MTTTKQWTIRALAVVAGILAAGGASASSHREAPAIAEDQYADNTDVYAFISPEDPDKLVIVANYVPFLLPASGPNFYRFSDSVAYEVVIDNNGNGSPDVVYRWDFHTRVANGRTFLYNTGPIDSVESDNLNVRQVYDLWRVVDHGRPERIAEDVPVAPWNVGSRSFPEGSYEDVALGAVHETVNGIKMFAGPRDEPFFVDLHVFDLLGVGGAHTTDGVNVMSLVLQVPISQLVEGNVRPPAGDDGPGSVLGIYARALRPQVTILGATHPAFRFGRYKQVSRLGWPLINEVVIPLQDKDRFNRSDPRQDVANFGAYILDPEVPKLLNLVLGAGCPMAPPDGRLDIVGLLSPHGTMPMDLLRIDITEGQTAADSHFPNGRSLTDDVTDTLLTVACNNGSAIGDGVDANDLPFTDTFPYLASPHSGNP